MSVLPPTGHAAMFSIGCQQIPDYQRPTWPSGPIPQQAHLDFYVPSVAEAVPRAVAAGAVPHEFQPSRDGQFVVLLDPAGHPFCLCEE
ncbi:hypothetical protein NQ038_13125 [Brevibacterium sp. 50QC2O2]|uniref:VOC family protein n=1 Tax=Brevibacterium sp. 50QC2O2 TaxID=2968459 RepID=UPI00211D01C6|nr:hypothetical protein [Brevibacterium sp. 50QC2O2]